MRRCSRSLPLLYLSGGSSSSPRSSGTKTKHTCTHKFSVSLWFICITLIKPIRCVCRTLSQVIHAVAVLLHPFIWQHTLISIVPEILIDVIMAPTPYLLGVQKRFADQVTDQTEVSDQTPDTGKTLQAIYISNPASWHLNSSTHPAACCWLIRRQEGDIYQVCKFMCTS